jgi:hypothetical protein
VLTYIAGLELDGGDLSPANFPLPKLGAKLRGLSRDVYNGKGFCVVRGVDPKVYAVEDLTLVYLGVQSYIADKRGRQDKRGNILGSSPFILLIMTIPLVLMLPLLVHIVADNSTKERDDHHRHSTKAIVSRIFDLLQGEGESAHTDASHRPSTMRRLATCSAGSRGVLLLLVESAS